MPLIEVRTASDSKPIRSVAVNNGEYPLNIDFSQVCKKRSTLNAVLNYMVKNYGMNLRTLTASDAININQAIKNHGFPEFKEIAEHAGFGKDENGNWTRLLIEDETFPLQEALDIQKDPRYNSNCGTY